MAQKILNGRMRLKRDTAAKWSSANPTLLSGELAIVVNTDGSVVLKAGDGSTTYKNLPSVGPEAISDTEILSVFTETSAIVLNGEQEVF